MPKLKIDALYNLKGNILLLPLSGNGDVVMTLKDVRTSVKTKITIQKLPEVCTNYLSLIIQIVIKMNFIS